jgi:hypothetical protein
MAKEFQSMQRPTIYHQFSGMSSGARICFGAAAAAAATLNQFLL